MPLSSLALTFLCGAAIESLFVLWLRYASERKPAASALASAAIGAAQLTGIGVGIHSLSAAVAWCLGYAVGTYIAVARSKK